MTDSLVQIAINPTVAKIITNQQDILDFVNEKLSYAVQGAEFTQAFSGGHWSGRSSFFSPKKHTFPSGFVHLVNNELVAAGHRVQLVRKPAPLPLGPVNPIVDQFGNDNPNYDYQIKALRQVEKHSRGIIRVATGGGKTKISQLLIARYNRMTMFITTRGVLMYQMEKSARAAGLKVGIVGDGVFTPCRGLNVAMVQTLVAKLQEPDLNAEIREVVRKHAVQEEKLLAAKLPALKALVRAEIVKQAQAIFDVKLKERNRIVKLLGMMEVVIGEEAHEAGGNSYYEIMKHCKNAHIRVALTATPFMKDNMEDNMRLMAAFGPILIDVSEELLINRGVLATPHFLFANAEPNPKLRKTSPYQRARQIGIVESEGRNAVIIKHVLKAKQYGVSSMILIQMKKHGDVLLGLCKAAGLKVVFLQGEDDNAQRRKTLNKLASGEIDAIIGTTILDVGVDVPAVGLVVLGAGGKAEVSLRQRIGRGLRAKKKTANVAFILDFRDELNTYLKDHANQRRAIIEGTPGFCENIIKGQDFDWDLLKMSKSTTPALL